MTFRTLLAPFTPRLVTLTLTRPAWGALSQTGVLEPLRRSSLQNVFISSMLMSIASGCVGAPWLETHASNIQHSPFASLRIKRGKDSEATISRILEPHRSHLREFLLENDFVCDAEACRKELFNIEMHQANFGSSIQDEIRWRVTVFLPHRPDEIYKLVVEETKRSSEPTCKVIAPRVGADPTPQHAQIECPDNHK